MAAKSILGRFALPLLVGPVPAKQPFVVSNIQLIAKRGHQSPGQPLGFVYGP